jgi:membrane protease YdiL (CAAX protease family)
MQLFPEGLTGVRLLRSPPVVMAVLWFVLTYLHLSGYFFRTTFTHGALQQLAASAMACVMMLVLYAAIVRVFEQRDADELRLGPMPREFVVGLLLGFGLYSACIAILMALGIYRIDGVGSWLVLLSGLAVPLATGVYEELLFRGGVFRLAERWFGTWIALVVSSVAFGFAHLGNADATMQGLLSISTWAGVLLAATYVLTRRLWLGIGLHAAWNYTQGTVYSGIVSGNANAGTGLVRSHMDGPGWLTGGTFGVEASVVALLVCTLVGAAMLVVASWRGEIIPPPWKQRL